MGPSSSMSASERRRPRERWKGRKYRRRDWILVIILAVLKLDLKVEAHTNWRERMKEENAREGRRGSRSRAREVRNNSHLLSRRKEGGEGDFR